MRIEITNGHVDIRDFVNRKVRRAYKSAIMKGVNIDIGTETGLPDEKMSLPVDNINEAQDVLVNSMVTNIEVNGKTVEDIRRFLDEEMGDRDFDKVARECQKLMEPDEAEKKKELNG